MNQTIDLLALPAYGDKRWPHPLALVTLTPLERNQYYFELQLYIHIEKFRGAQSWGVVNAANYVPLPGTWKYTTVVSLRARWDIARSTMREDILLHNQRAQAHNLLLQQQQQQQQQQAEEEEEEEEEDDDDDDATETALFHSTISAMKAKREREAGGL